MVKSSVIEVPVARIYIDTPVITGEVIALCLTEPICELVIGNITGVRPTILGEVVKTEEEDMQHLKVIKTAEEEMQLDTVTPDSEASYYEVTQSSYEGDGINVE